MKLFYFNFVFTLCIQIIMWEYTLNSDQIVYTYRSHNLFVITRLNEELINFGGIPEESGHVQISYQDYIICLITPV